MKELVKIFSVVLMVLAFTSNVEAQTENKNKGRYKRNLGIHLDDKFPIIEQINIEYLMLSPDLFENGIQTPALVTLNLIDTDNNPDTFELVEMIHYLQKGGKVLGRCILSRVGQYNSDGTKTSDGAYLYGITLDDLDLEEYTPHGVFNGFLSAWDGSFIDYFLYLILQESNNHAINYYPKRNGTYGASAEEFNEDYKRYFEIMGVPENFRP